MHYSLPKSAFNPKYWVTCDAEDRYGFEKIWLIAANFDQENKVNWIILDNRIILKGESKSYPMNAEQIIRKFYDRTSKLHDVLIQHGEDVAGMAVDIARNLPDSDIDIDFVAEASMLHDIGIFLVNLPELDCYGKHSYICHGYLGRELLEELGFPKHGLVCERHVGVGITTNDIIAHRLPLPVREMIPVSIEEQIICYADKFFSKNKNGSSGKKSVEKIIHKLETYGHDKAIQFELWVKKFNGQKDAEP